MSNSDTCIPTLNRILCAVCALLSQLCLIYWLICGIFAGFNISELWVWLLFSALFMILILWFSGIGFFGCIRKSKLVVVIIDVLLLLSVLLFATVEAFIIFNMRSDPGYDPDCVIVLGAKVKGNTPSRPLRYRILRAYEYLEDHPRSIAVASGGQGNDEIIPEGKFIKDSLVSMGIDEDRIIVEDRSSSTTENILFSMELLPNGEMTVGIVTNNFHILRSVLTAKKLTGRDFCGIAADFPSFLIIHYMVREFFALSVLIV